MKFILSNYLILVFILGLSLSSCEKEVSVSTNEKESENHAKIFINSKPAGAKIYLDGKNTGYITPDTVKWLLAGEYKVTLKKEYFKDTNVVVLIDY
ncbi:MAG: PEGA domain-containing protein, partial [Ignavibacteria bacterium]|nr:PEGA domain-containing protein [Ignavibacteria bacterium]